MRILAGKDKSRQRGATQIEFVLSILVTILVVFWTWEIVMLVYTYSVMSDAAKEGVRYAIVHGSNSTLCSGPKTPACPDPTGTNIVNRVKAFTATSLHDVSAITVTPTWPSTNAPPNLVRVNITYTYIPYLKLPWTPPTITTTAEGRIIY